MDDRSRFMQQWLGWRWDSKKSWIFINFLLWFENLCQGMRMLKRFYIISHEKMCIQCASDGAHKTSSHRRELYLILIWTEAAAINFVYLLLFIFRYKPILKRNRSTEIMLRFEMRWLTSGTACDWHIDGSKRWIGARNAQSAVFITKWKF